MAFKWRHINAVVFRCKPDALTAELTAHVLDCKELRDAWLVYLASFLRKCPFSGRVLIFAPLWLSNGSARLIPSLPVNRPRVAASPVSPQIPDARHKQNRIASLYRVPIY